MHTVADKAHRGSDLCARSLVLDIQKEYSDEKSKPIIDEIDKVLAKHYGFTEEELDFIINYDIKYRMGDELNENE